MKNKYKLAWWLVLMYLSYRFFFSASIMLIVFVLDIMVRYDLLEKVGKYSFMLYYISVTMGALCIWYMITTMYWDHLFNKKRDRLNRGGF